jgi:hypothetical protein
LRNGRTAVSGSSAAAKNVSYAESISQIEEPVAGHTARLCNQLDALASVVDDGISILTE